MRKPCRHVEVELYSLLKQRKAIFNSDRKQYWYLNNFTNKLPINVQRRSIREAFQRWNDHIREYGKEFVETLEKEKAYIQIYFGGGEKDGPTDLYPDTYEIVFEDEEMIAFWIPKTGDIWLNDAVEWDIEKSILLGVEPVDLSCALEHELGHLQYIAHTKDNPNDIMFAQYVPGNRITEDTVEAIKELYENRRKQLIRANLLIYGPITVIVIYLLYKLLT